jgi:hypothetical protein
MECNLDQNSVRELMTNSAINAVKLLTSNQSMKETFYFQILDVPNRLKFYDIMVNLQKEQKLNFITNVFRCMQNNNIQNLIVACRNSSEFNNFVRRCDRIIVKGYHLKVVESSRPIVANLVKVPVDLRHAVRDLSRILSFNASTSYSKVFPTERILEILLEMEAAGLISVVSWRTGKN